MFDFLDKVGLKDVLNAVESKCALRSKYGDTTIDVGRKAGSEVGRLSSALGYNTVATGEISYSEGLQSEAIGDASHAEGVSSRAYGVASHAEGVQTSATKQYSHAEGGNTIADGDNSHAEGFSTLAQGNSSHAEGVGTVTTNEAEHASGKYNESKFDTLFSIGDGTAGDARHNAFEITTTGGKLHDKDIATFEDIVRNTSDWVPMKFEVTCGDHNYPKSGIDDSIPSMPTVCNYTFIVSRNKSDNSVANILAIPIDYDDDVMLYQMRTGVWEKVADGGNADTVDGYHGSDFLKPSDIKRLSYTITFSQITWSTSGYGKYYYHIELPENINVISVYGGAFESFYPDEVIQVYLDSSKIVELVSNVDKKTGKLTVHISYF